MSSGTLTLLNPIRKAAEQEATHVPGSSDVEQDCGQWASVTDEEGWRRQRKTGPDGDRLSMDHASLQVTRHKSSQSNIILNRNFMDYQK